jgi:hypothetical protein
MHFIFIFIYFFTAGQHPVQQMAGHSGADIAGLQSHGPSSYLNQAGPSPLEEIVLGSTSPQVQSNSSLLSFILRSSQSSMQFVDQYGNSRLPPSNETHFQAGEGQGHSFQEQQYGSAGTSAMGSLGSDHDSNQAHNQVPGSGILHMPSFQDSTDQDYFQVGNDQSTTAVEAGQASLEGSPDTSSEGDIHR